MNKYNLLKKLCEVHAPSGNEGAMTQFLIDNINTHKHTWKSEPQLFYGKGFQDTLVMVFGKPRTALYAHIDSVGYMVAYDTSLIEIGTPRAKSGTPLVGADSLGAFECSIAPSQDKDTDSNAIRYQFKRNIERGTTLTYKPIFKETEHHIQASYIDNRVGVWTALMLAEKMENGVIAFSTYEETGGGSAQFLQRFLHEKFSVNQALICDITWVTAGVAEGKGPAVSLHDSRIPRRAFVDKIRAIAQSAALQYQIEVERGGGSDGTVLQSLSLPVDWCFVGVPIKHAHEPLETINKQDLNALLKLYSILMKEL